MKNKNLKIIFCIILLIASILLTGCSMLGRNDDIKDIDWHTGTDGIVMEFMEGLPPDEVYVGTPFKVGLNLENIGATDVTDAWILVSSYDEFIIDYLSPHDNPFKDINLKGRSNYNPQGDFYYATFDFVPNKDILELYPDAMVATVCYPYKTLAVAEVCINPQFREYQDTEVCEVETVTLKGGQGAPVEVTEVEPTLLPYEETMDVNFKITIENAGNGNVYASETYFKECSSRPDDVIFNFEKDKIRIDATLSGINLNCQLGNNPRNVVYLNEKGEGYIICSANIPIKQQVYMTPLEITLDYGYAESIIKNFDIISYYKNVLNN